MNKALQLQHDGRRSFERKTRRKNYYRFDIQPGLQQLKDEVSQDSSIETSSRFNEITRNASGRLLYRAVWHIFLGFAAMLDCFATVLPDHLVLRDPPNPKRASGLFSLGNEEANIELVEKVRFFGREYNLTSPLISDSLQWLGRNSVYFGCFFSFLWIIQAFRDARNTRRKALRERDRRKLMKRGDSIRFDCSSDSYYEGYEPWLAFAAKLLLQLLLVPVAFYVFIYNVLHKITTDDVYTESLIANSTSNNPQYWSSLFKSCIQPENCSRSTLVLLIKHLRRLYLNNLGTKIKSAAVRRGWQEGRKLSVRAIIHPRKFIKSARKALKWLRWVKYVVPLVLASNKLRGNFVELAKKRRQRRQADLAMKVRKILWKQLSPEERRHRAARGIQSMYRSYKVRKTRWALAIFLCQQEELAAIRVQIHLRKWLQRAKARIKERKEELEQLDARLHKDLRRGRRMTMPALERKRLYQLEDEMKTKKCDFLDRRLLVRPNTGFAVTWKAIYVFCILVELSGKAVNPLLLSNYKNRSRNEPITFSNHLESFLVPKAISSLPVCSSDTGRNARYDFRVFSMVGRPALPRQPWFCSSFFAAMQSMYTSLIRMFLSNFMVVVGFIVFLDVPVQFFTGEICPDTGAIIPKPFVKRWIMPGLFLQLIVNPQMATISALIYRVMIGSFEIGPIRVWRWVEALFYPSLVLFVNLVEHKIMVPFVAYINKDRTEEDSVSKNAPPAVQRSIMMRSSIRRASRVDNRRRSSHSIRRSFRRSSLWSPSSIPSFTESIAEHQQPLEKKVQ